VNEESLTHKKLWHQIKYSIGMITRPEEPLCVSVCVCEWGLDLLGLSNQNKILCWSEWPLSCWDRGLITRPEESCVNEEVLTHRALSRQVKYNIGYNGTSPAEIVRSNSTEAWMFIYCRDDYSSWENVVCEWRGPDPLWAVKPSKIQCQARCPLACWDREFEFQQGLDVCYRSDHSSREFVVY